MRISGFNLLELLITLAIVAILATIAFSSYSHYVMKTRHAEAKVALMEMASRLEYYYAEHHTYESASKNDSENSFKSAEGYYQLHVLQQSSSDFMIEASPVFQDATCGSFRLNAIGQKSITGTGTVASCWG